MAKGYVIMAQDIEGSNRYFNCAKALELSLKTFMPHCNVKILTNDDLPYGDLAKNNNWKLLNDWQVYEASPFDETIKIEADIFIPKDITYWWDILSLQDLVVCTNIRNYRGELSDSRFYRRFVDDNLLPDTYNGLTYFKKSKISEKFFNIVRDVFENWEEYKKILKCSSIEPATTDWAYAIASHIIGVEKTTMHLFKDFSFIHMKQYINGTATENWTDTMVYEILKDKIRINTYPQMYPLHYHVKNFSEKILKEFNHE